MTREEILNSNNTKTKKIEMLLELGMTRKEVAEFAGIPYGFIQNVFAKKYPEKVKSKIKKEPAQETETAKEAEQEPEHTQEDKQNQEENKEPQKKKEYFKGMKLVRTKKSKRKKRK